MAETSLPNPGSTTMYFIGITIFLIGLTISNIRSAEDISAISARREYYIHNIIYILVVIVGSYFINVTISKAMCNQSIQWGYILLITLLPWIIIFITLYGVLYLFPGWISPFSNTIGYLVIVVLGVEKTYGNIFKTGEEASGNPELVKAIANMNSNKTKFINQISSDLIEFIDFFKNMKDAVKSNIIIPDIHSGNETKSDAAGIKPDIKPGIKPDIKPGIKPGIKPELADASPDGPTTTTNEQLKGGAIIRVSNLLRSRPKDAVPINVINKPDTTINKDYLLELYRLLVIKQLIGKAVWFILAGILICSISYNLIINMSCEKSVAELTKEFETAKEEITESRLNVSPEPLAVSSGIALNSSSSANLTAGLTQQFGTQ